MEPFGDYLKQARDKKGLSFEQVTTQTRIQERHLQALESEDFANLPAKVFAKGFVRSYAKVLGLDEEEALQRFLDVSNNYYEQHHPEQPHVQVTIEGGHRPPINWKIVGLAIVSLAAGALWYWFPSGQKPITTLPQSEVASHRPETNEPEPVEAPATEEKEVSQPLDTTLPTQPEGATPVVPVPTTPEGPTVEPAPPNPPSEAPSVDSLQTLEVEATQLTWVVVQSDQEAPNEALLQPGQRITWKAQKQFLLTLGNAAGVVVRLNGESQGPFGKPGQVVRNIRLRP